MTPPSLTAPGPPAELTSFVGRESELQLLETRLVAHEARLITLLGPPGMGKTRLATRLLRSPNILEHFRGVAFVDLSGAENEPELYGSVAAALGMVLSREERAEERIADALGARERFVLILDNFEQLVQHAGIVARWLAAAPLLQCLVTSRELLRIPGELALELAPLGVPDASEREPSAVLQSSCVQLLLARAGSLQLTPENAQLVGEVARALEGIPLAVELCAARLATLGLQGVRARLDDRLGLLSHGARTASDRQATLRGAITWSWRLLSEPERNALMLASVFVGGFDAQAFEAVARGEFDSPLDVLQALRDKSLVRALARDDLRGELRLGMYESIRAYAREQCVACARMSAWQLRHAQYFARFGQSWLDKLESQAADAARVALTVERENLQAAYDTLRLEAAGPYQAASAELCLALEPVLARSGLVARHRLHLQQVIAAASFAALAGTLRARLLRARARDLRQRAALVEAAGCLEQALALLTGDASDAASWAKLSIDFGELEQERGDFVQAKARHQAALHKLDASVEPYEVTRALRGLGLQAQGRGELSEALSYFEVALTQALEMQDVALQASLNTHLGNTRLQQGRQRDAELCYTRAATLLQQLADPDPEAVAATEANLAILLQERGAYEQAAQRFQRALDRAALAGARLLHAGIDAYMGALAHEQGEFSAACVTYERVLRVFRQFGDKRQAGFFAGCLSAALASLDQLSAAEEALQEARSWLQPLGDEGLLTALELQGAQLLLAQSRLASQAGNVEVAERARAEAESVARRRARETALTDDARWALRILESSLRRGAWVFDRARGELAGPQATLIALSKRPQLERLVRALVEQRLEAPGHVLTPEDLLQAGWPGERMQHDAASNRLKVALSTLRSMGLQPLLQRVDAGYRLDPGVPLLEQAGDAR